MTDVSAIMRRLTDAFDSVAPEDRGDSFRKAAVKLPRKKRQELLSQARVMCVVASGYCAALGSGEDDLFSFMPNKLVLMNLFHAIDPAKLSCDALGCICEEFQKLNDPYAFRKLPPALADAVLAWIQDEDNAAAEAAADTPDEEPDAGEPVH